MTALNSAMPPLPSRFLRLPIDHRGYPVPRFVWQKPDGTFDFRVIKPGWPEACRGNRLCWLCGEKLGVLMCFVIGPMCAINRNTSEPPCHRECAEFAVKACPFLCFPNRKRDEADLPADGEAAGGEIAMIMRNPGVTCLWITRQYRPYRANGSVLIQVGDPVEVTWWAHGRAATRDEVLHSIDTGLPILAERAREGGADDVKLLEWMVERGLKLVPAA